MSRRMRRIVYALPRAGLASALLPAALSAQLLTADAPVRGALEASDPLDPEGYVHDLVPVAAGLAGRFAVILESEDFDAFLEWGVMDGGEFRLLVTVDDSPGLASDTDARLLVGLEGEGDRVVRVTSLDGGPDGAYTLSLRALPAVEPRVVRLAYGDRVDGSLGEDDQLWGVRFVDTYRFEGRAGERFLAGLSAEFDGFLSLVPVQGVEPALPPAQDDDGFGSLDAFLEVDLPADGTYELAVTSWEQATGDYRLDVWSAPALVPVPDAPPTTGLASGALGDGVSFTAEERNGLRVSDNEVWNDLLGFRFPAPGPDLVVEPADGNEWGVGQMASMGWDMAAWEVTAAVDDRRLAVFALRSPGPVGEDDFAVAQFLRGMIMGFVAGAAENQVSSEEDFEGSRSLESWVRRTVEGDEGVIGIRCQASDEERDPGLIVCVLGAGELAVEDRLRASFRGLEIR